MTETTSEEAIDVQQFCDERYVDQKTGMITRHPTLAETDALMAALADGGRAPFDLRTTPSWVLEKDGKIVACLAARMVFNVVPFPVHSEDGQLLVATGRNERILFEACHRWMRSTKNAVGAHFSITFAEDDEAGEVLRKLGWRVLDKVWSRVFLRSF